nr:MAG TPA: tail protein [Caudoviricetes sp.]
MTREWKVYSSDGKTVKATTKRVEYNGEYMGSCSLTVTFESPVPINFEIGDYIEYRIERFYLNVLPSSKKQCSRNGSKNAFAYENVQFMSVSDELVRCDFLDVVKKDNYIHWTALPTFSFYCEGVKNLAERIQANLDRVYGENVWTIQIDKTYEDSRKDIQISISNQSVWDALLLVNTTFKTNFIIRGRTVTIGTTSNNIDHVFSCGIGRGLLSITRASDTNQKVITRLRAFGNTTNVPTNYYKYLCMKIMREYVVPTDLEMTLTVFDRTKWYVTTLTLHDKWAQDGLSYSCKAETPPRDSYEDFDKFIKYMHPTLEITYDGDKVVYATVGKWEYEGKTTYRYIVVDEAFWHYMSNRRPEGKVTLSFGGTSALNYNYIVTNHKGVMTSANYPNNMAITRLMLPGFPNGAGETDCGYVDKAYEGYKLIVTSNDVYIESPQKKIAGLREGSVYIDGTDNEVTDYNVYPSIEDMTVEDLNKAGIYPVLDDGDNGKLNQVANASKIEDNGDSDYNTGQASETFVWIKDLGFNIWDYRTGSETPNIYLKSGKCVGRTFDIKNCIRDGNKYKLTIIRKSDNDLNILYPNSQSPIAGGDEFVILNIKMPDVYYKAASQRLLKYALLYLKENDKTKFSYTPVVDNLWIARQHDANVSLGAKSIYTNIKEGDRMEIDEASDLGIASSIFISNLKITESEDSLIPLVEISLQDDKKAVSVNRSVGQLPTMMDASTGEGTSSTILLNQISRYGYLNFLSKVGDDEASGKITFNKGIDAFSTNVGAADGITEYEELT